MLKNFPGFVENGSKVDFIQGGVAQMVERSLSMREVPGSIPGISKLFRNRFYFFELAKNKKYTNFRRKCPISNRFLDGNDGQSPSK